MPRRPKPVVHASNLMQELSLGALMKTIPLERVKEALSETGTTSERQRLLPAPMVAYLVLMLAFYSEASVRENLRLLLEPLRRKFGLARVKVPVGSAITKARKRLLAKPFAWLFDRVAHPLGDPAIPGCFWKKYRVVATDTTTAEVQNTDENRRRFGIYENQHGASGYPAVKTALLVECGTRAPFACSFGGADEDDGALFDRLRHTLTKEMLFLTDRGFYSFERFKDCASRAGALLWRVKKSMVLRALEVFADGSFLAKVRPSHKLVRKGLAKADERMIVRVIEYRPQFANGTEGETVRLLTNIIDPKDASAEELALLYAQRWESESGFDELKTHLRGPTRVLRSPLPELVEQELYGFLLAYYVIRATITEAARNKGSPPREFSFIHAVRVIRRRLSFPPENEARNERDIREHPA